MSSHAVPALFAMLDRALGRRPLPPPSTFARRRAPEADGRWRALDDADARDFRDTEPFVAWVDSDLPPRSD